MNRRSFFKCASIAVTSFFLAPLMYRKGSVAFAQEKPPLSESDSTAQEARVQGRQHQSRHHEVSEKSWGGREEPEMLAVQVLLRDRRQARRLHDLREQHGHGKRLV